MRHSRPKVDDRVKAVDALCQKLALTQRPARLEEALTHPSFRNEAKRLNSPQHAGHLQVLDNQRLEFLGDAVLSLCVSEILVAAYPQADEGKLSRMRSALVNTDALAAFARQNEVGPALRLGRGAGHGAERDLPNVLADAVEAIVAAVYLDGGLERARALTKLVVGDLSARTDVLADRDAKSRLQELIQGQGKPTPSYRLISSGGQNLDRWFDVEVCVGETVLALGKGRSRKAAEQDAAKNALQSLEPNRAG